MRPKTFALILIKFIPSNFIKIALLRNLFGCKIGKNVTIGRSIINCDKVKIGNGVQIGNKNTISCKQLNVGADTKIIYSNRFIGNATFSIGENSRIISSHYFDLYNNINIGNNTWIAGNNSQFWTHGSMQTKTGKDLSINIKDDVYVGSASRFAPGTKIASFNLIGLGSVVAGNFETENTIIMGNPAKVVKQNIDWRENW